MKLLIDMNMSPEWVDVFRDAGFAATHWSQLGPANTQDAEIMAFAAANGYAVFTNDLDFATLLAITSAGSPSRVQVRADKLLPKTLGSRCLRVCATRWRSSNKGPL